MIDRLWYRKHQTEHPSRTQNCHAPKTSICDWCVWCVLAIYIWCPVLIWHLVLVLSYKSWEWYQPGRWWTILVKCIWHFGNLSLIRWSPDDTVHSYQTLLSIDSHWCPCIDHWTAVTRPISRNMVNHWEMATRPWVWTMSPCGSRWSIRMPSLLSRVQLLLGYLGSGVEMNE